MYDTIPESGLGLHRLGLEEISGDQCWQSCPEDRAVPDLS